MNLGKWYLLFCLIAATGCERSGTLNVGDVTKPQSFTVKARSSSPTGITIQANARLNGTAYVYVHEYDKVVVSGTTVDPGIYHDWFQQDCTIYFEPGTATSGSLEISYAFD